MGLKSGTTFYVSLLLCLSLIGCAAPPAQVFDTPPKAYVVESVDTMAMRYAPVVVPQSHQQSYNRIGQVVARYDSQQQEEIYIDPEFPVYYLDQQDFHTAHGKYTNLIYRIHFQKVPVSLVPFHITAGKLGGLLVVITINSAGEPLLVTTVHTCGCYLAIVPTNYLPAAAYPHQWDPQGQTVYGERLPGRLDFPTSFSTDFRPMILLRHAVHRVMDIKVVSRQQLAQDYDTIETQVMPTSSLHRLPLNGRFTSFYHTKGWRKGYVRGSVKPFELLFMSWWVLDPLVGSDKAYGDSDDTGTVFYTSLKPWRRKDSDMWHFQQFLALWGWRL